ncbi:hypothetical protein GON26_10595 [Flavobacterium sp. GA093]|uniref:Uncharacterized protein n=1 Tax=Flavobacterium hydrocarbonoxydans TaxID=2683249 RepID=A0A6I4NQM6_9FLAO|nr:hypothetical protein [Flavobacterium hydrocarbonoxydans]MWB94815.1 hypothetical protein [Flavobacterium hydrocarbonoxydans]
MNWIRKTLFLVTLLIVTLFAFQADQVTIEKNDEQKTENSFSTDQNDALAFIQPEATYHFAATQKTTHFAIVKWFDSLLTELPHFQAVKSANNFVNQCFNQSKKVSILLYPFHFFW